MSSQCAIGKCFLEAQNESFMVIESLKQVKVVIECVRVLEMNNIEPDPSTSDKEQNAATTSTRSEMKIRGTYKVEADCNRDRSEVNNDEKDEELASESSESDFESIIDMALEGHLGGGY